MTDNFEIEILIEDPNGRTFTMRKRVYDGNVKKVLNSIKSFLGKGYHICDWWEVEK